MRSAIKARRDQQLKAFRGWRNELLAGTAALQHLAELLQSAVGSSAATSYAETTVRLVSRRGVLMTAGTFRIGTGGSLWTSGGAGPARPPCHLCTPR